jgi:hypothetical protein
MRTQSDHRRSGGFPGRRSALATTIACVVAVGGALLPATAAADQAVVSATIFPGTAGNYSIQPVMLSKLAGSCPTYDGPLWTFPGGQGPSTTATVWSLGDVITCGLGTTESNVTAVKVFNGDTNTYEATLAPDQVFNPGTYPSGALPLISINGSMTSGGAVTYTRPPTGPSDPAQSDQFTEDGTTPVSIDVYENQLPLQVTPAPAPVPGSAGASSEEVTLAATVTTPDGAAIDPSQLTWNWSFGGSPVESAATPTVDVRAGDSELASVIVTDQATGAGGTATFDVAYNPSPGTPTNTTPTPGAGSGNQGAPTGQPNGKKHAHGKPQKLNHSGGLDHAGTHRGARTIRSQRHSTRTSHPSTTASPPATTPPPATQTTNQTTTVTMPPPTPTTTPGLTVDRTPTKTPHHQRAHAPKRRSTAQPGASERRVTGRLVADVQALPESKSPLVHPIVAQAAAPSLVHAASDGTSAPTWAYATLAVLVLLAGGALYERRGRRGRTLHR